MRAFSSVLTDCSWLMRFVGSSLDVGESSFIPNRSNTLAARGAAGLSLDSVLVFESDAAHGCCSFSSSASAWLIKRCLNEFHKFHTIIVNF